MGLGAVIMLIGLAVGAIVSPPLIAQRDGVFDEILCRKITVVDSVGTEGVVLESNEEVNQIIVKGKIGGGVGLKSHRKIGNVLSIVSQQGELAVVAKAEESGILHVFGEHGKGEVRLRGEGVITLFNKQKEPAVGLLSDEHGGAVSVFNKQSEFAVNLVATEYGGRANVYNNQGERRAVMGVNEYGNGAVSTWDKNGYRQ